MANLLQAEILSRRDFLRGGGASIAWSLLPQCVIANSGSVPATTQPVPNGPITAASMTVANTPYVFSQGSYSAIASIKPYFMGFSYEKSGMNRALFNPDNTELINLLNLLGTGLLRIGAKTVQQNVWTPTGAGSVTLQIAPSDVTNFAAFIQATSWKVIYGVPCIAPSGQPATMAQLSLAAEEAVYAMQALGASLYAFEIGNEPDLSAYGWTAGTTAAAEATWEPIWEQYRTAIVAAAQAASLARPAFVGPSTAGDEWAAFLANDKASEIALLSDHHYLGAQSDSDATIATVMTTDGHLLGDLYTLAGDVESATGGALPYRITEENTFTEVSESTSQGGTNQSLECSSYATALWAIDTLFENALNGGTGVNFHGGCDYRTNSSGNDTDYAYTPINDDLYTSNSDVGAGGAIVPHAEYCGMYLFTLAGQGLMLNLGTMYTTPTVSAYQAGINVSAYAVENSNGMSLVINNKGPVSTQTAQHLQLSVALPTKYTTAYLWQLSQLSSGATEPDLTAQSGVTIQGAPITSDGKFALPAPYTVNLTSTMVTFYVPYWSAVVVQLR